MFKSKLLEKNKWPILAFFILGLLVSLGSFGKPEVEATASPEPQDSIDTLIPAGHILVPLDLENAEQIGSLIGNTGVVDLYTGGEEIKVRKLIAARVKLIQAPYNPQVYAALVKEQEGSLIQNYLGPFRAVVQNPNQTGSKVHQQNRKKFSITYQR